MCVLLVEKEMCLAVAYIEDQGFVKEWCDIL